MQVITRAQWGAAPPKRSLTPIDLDRVEWLHIHYVGADVGRDPDGAGLMRSIQRGHLRHATIDYSDIAYSWGVHPLTGVIYEGRGWHVDGATLGWGGRSLSILVMVGDGGPTLTAAGIAGVSAVVAEIRARCGRPVPVRGHDEAPGNDTSCPGRALLDLIHAGAFEGGTTAPTPAAPQEDIDMDETTLQRIVAETVRAELRALLGPWYAGDGQHIQLVQPVAKHRLETPAEVERARVYLGAEDRGEQGPVLDLIPEAP